MTDAVVATITILFTDLVDSTGLLRHGSAVANEMRRSLDAATASTVRRHRGVVIKSTGDGTMATFTSAGGAVAAAVAIQQAVDHLRQADHRVPPLRIGLATGEATNEGGDWFGPPVIEAARLVSDADGGQILTGGIVATLVGTQGEHRFATLEPRLLKGFDHPVAVSEVEWSPLPLTVLPGSAEAALKSAAPFVGRAQERDRLLEAWKHAATAERIVCLVAGEPGVGKTRLAAELVRSVTEERGSTVLWGRCHEDPVVPYEPFVEHVRQWLASDSTRVLPPDLERLVPDAGLVVATGATPTRTDIDPGVGGEADRSRVFAAVASLLRGIAADGPVLLVIDDMHWATVPTLLLFRHVLNALAGERVLVLGSYRDTEVDRQHPLAGVLADLHREDGVLRLSLDGIDTPSVVEYLERIGDQRLNEAGIEFAHALRAETKGNPFFIGQILRHLVETGALERSGGRWATVGSVAELGLPEGVREVIGRRLSRLSDPANAALRVASVVGPEFDLATVEAVSDVRGPDSGDDPERLLDALDECVAARLIHEVSDRVGRYGFVHALVRHTLLFELTAARRARLHRRVGDVLVAMGGAEAATLAFHYLNGATAGEVGEALDWSNRAAWSALDRFAPEEAMTIVDRALKVADLTPNGHAQQRAWLWLYRSRASELLGDTPSAKEAAAMAADEARRASDPELFVIATTARAGWPILGSSDPVALALFEEARAMVTDLDPGLRSRLLGDLAFYRANSEGDGMAVLPLMAEATQLARETGDPESIARSLRTQSLLYTAHHDLHAQEVLLAEIESLLERFPAQVDWNAQHIVERGRVNLSAQRGDFAAARAAIARAAVLHDEQNQRSGFEPMWQAALALAEGRLDDARLANERLAAFTVDANFANSWGAQLLFLRRYEGRSAEVLPFLEDGVKASPGLVSLRALLALTCVDAGDLQRARPLFDELAVDEFAALPRDPTWATSLAALTEVCTALGDQRAAATLRERLLPFSGQLLVVAWTVAVLGAADRFIGMHDAVLEHPNDADARFAAALALEEAAGATALAATTRQWRERTRTGQISTR